MSAEIEREIEARYRAVLHMWASADSAFWRYLDVAKADAPEQMHHAPRNMALMVCHGEYSLGIAAQLILGGENPYTAFPESDGPLQAARIITEAIRGAQGFAVWVSRQDALLAEMDTALAGLPHE